VQGSGCHMSPEGATHKQDSRSSCLKTNFDLLYICFLGGFGGGLGCRRAFPKTGILLSTIIWTTCSGCSSLVGGNYWIVSGKKIIRQSKFRRTRIHVTNSPVDVKTIIGVEKRPKRPMVKGGSNATKWSGGKGQVEFVVFFLKQIFTEGGLPCLKVAKE